MHSRNDQLHGLCNYKTLSINQFTLSCNYLHDCMLCLGTTSIPTFVTQNSQWPFLFNPHPPSSKQPFQSGKISQHFEGPFFEVESIGLALCQYVTGAGFPLTSGQLFFNNGRVYRDIKNEINMEYVLLNC